VHATGLPLAKPIFLQQYQGQKFEALKSLDVQDSMSTKWGTLEWGW